MVEACALCEFGQMSRRSLFLRHIRQGISQACGGEYRKFLRAPSSQLATNKGTRGSASTLVGCKVHIDSMKYGYAWSPPTAKPPGAGASTESRPDARRCS